MNIKYFFTFQSQKQIKLPDNMNVLKHVGRYGFTNNIWREVWRNCYFFNVSQRKLCEILLSEINRYRHKHKVPPVNFNSRLDNVATTNLHSLINRNRQINNQLLRNFLKVPYYMTPLIFKKWYEKGKSYKYNTKSSIKGTEHFSSMVGKNLDI
uniref:SCP domain-containing protein n=1 Tax=Strongyloides venezuelensis TaxID=75913 RepID=A0A0K0G231_STRVS